MMARPASVKLPSLERSLGNERALLMADVFVCAARVPVPAPAGGVSTGTTRGTPAPPAARGRSPRSLCRRRSAMPWRRCSPPIRPPTACPRPPRPPAVAPTVGAPRGSTGGCNTSAGRWGCTAIAPAPRPPMPRPASPGPRAASATPRDGGRCLLPSVAGRVAGACGAGNRAGVATVGTKAADLHCGHFFLVRSQARAHSSVACNLQAQTGHAQAGSCDVISDKQMEQVISPSSCAQAALAHCGCSSSGPRSAPPCCRNTSRADTLARSESQCWAAESIREQRCKLQVVSCAEDANVNAVRTLSLLQPSHRNVFNDGP